MLQNTRSKSVVLLVLARRMKAFVYVQFCFFAYRVLALMAVTTVSTFRSVVFVPSSPLIFHCVLSHQVRSQQERAAHPPSLPRSFSIPKQRRHSNQSVMNAIRTFVQPKSAYSRIPNRRPTITVSDRGLTDRSRAERIIFHFSDYVVVVIWSL